MAVVTKGQPPPFAVAPITAKRDVIHKTGSTHRSATPPDEDRATVTGKCTQNFLPIGPAVPEVYSRTDRHT